MSSRQEENPLYKTKILFWYCIQILALKIMECMVSEKEGFYYQKEEKKRKEKKREEKRGVINGII